VGEARGVALVSGAGRGLGRALAVELAASGFDVALLARSADQLAVGAAAVRDRGRRALELPIDLGDEAAAGAAARLVLEELGAVDVLINNAAELGPVVATAEVDPASWARTLAVNVVGAATLTFAVLPAMIERGRGEIVDVSSRIVADPGAMPRGNAYVTSKAALEAHAINLAGELAGTGVVVNVCRPGVLDTAQQSWLREQGPEAIGQALHARYSGFATSGRLEDPARVARWLVARLGAAAAGEIWDYEAVRRGGEGGGSGGCRSIG
jgi:NAD(P)-dependent dehydrogenase (short-subunit alcohol dehydrogenase family)